MCMKQDDFKNEKIIAVIYVLFLLIVGVVSFLTPNDCSDVAFYCFSDIETSIGLLIWSLPALVVLFFKPDAPDSTTAVKVLKKFVVLIMILAAVPSVCIPLVYFLMKLF